MDFKIPEYFSRIIREVDAKNSNDINKAIRFLVNKLHKIEEFEKFKKYKFDSWIHVYSC